MNEHDRRMLEDFQQMLELAAKEREDLRLALFGSLDATIPGLINTFNHQISEVRIDIAGLRSSVQTQATWLKIVAGSAFLGPVAGALLLKNLLG